MDNLFSDEIENFVISGDAKYLETLVPNSMQQKFSDLLNKIREEINNKVDKLSEDIFVRLFDMDEENSEASLLLRRICLAYEFNNQKTSEDRKKEIISEISGGEISTADKKYNYIGNNNTVTEETKRLPSELKPSDLLIDDIFAEIDKGNINAIKKIPPHIFPLYYDMNRLSNDILLLLLSIEGRNSFDIMSIDYSRQDDNFLKKLANSIDKILENAKAESSIANQINSDISRIIETMTPKQIEFLEQNLSSNLINKDTITLKLLEINFSSKFNAAEREPIEYRKTLFELYEFLKNKTLRFESMRLQVLLNILENGIEINVYDLEIFKLYINNPLFYVSSAMISKSKEWESNCVKNERNMSYISGIASYDINKSLTIIHSYLKYFFVYENKSLEDFSDYFTLEFLEPTYYKSLLSKGEDNPNYLQKLGKNNYSSLSQAILIDICNFNKKRFEINEPVILTIDIQNVPTLIVQIFEINTENYYLKNKSSINSNISLEGLVSTYNQTYCFSEKPGKVLRKNFTFDKIPEKRGIYVIELIGGGFSSRSIIQKGGLTAISKNTYDGIVYYILDESGEICNDKVNKSTGLWIKETFYPVANESGAILVPYFNTSSNEKAVLVHSEFAELANVTLYTENYAFSGIFIINQESLIMGSSSKILFSPALKVNDTPISVTKTKNASVTLTLTKEENGQHIPIINKYDDIKFAENEEVKIEFQVPPKLKRIRVEVNCEVANRSQSTNSKLVLTKEVSVNSSSSNNYSNIHLFKNRKGENFLQILGKNGETKKNVEVTLNMSHYLLHDKITKKLSTNDDGIISLGELKYIYHIIANYTYLGQGINAEFSPNHEMHCSIPDILQVTENTDFEIPLGTSDFDPREFSIFKYSESESKLENLLLNPKQLKVVTGKSISSEEGLAREYSVLKFSNLTQGTYKILWNFYADSVVTQIKVLKGEYWNGNSFIKSNDMITQVSDNLNLIRLENLSIDYKTNLVKFKIANCSNKSRVHILAYKYTPYLQVYNSLGLAKYFNNCFNSDRKSFTYSKWANLYLNNRLLNEEVKYVLDRKDQERYTGNTLEKPSLLMKRQFIRDTTTEIRDAKSGTIYKDAQLSLGVSEDRNRNRKCEKKALTRSISNVKEAYLNLVDRLYTKQNGDILSVLDFLSLSPILIENLIPNEEGFVEVEIKDLDYYSSLQVIALDNKSICDEIVAIDSPSKKARELKDLSLQNILDPEKPFCENRSNYALIENDKHKITDITSSSFKLIDSIENYLSYVALTSPDYTYFKSKFSELLSFDTLNLSQKFKFVSECFCHEVNVYLFFKHPEFFDAYIKPVIKHKSEKTLVDFALLNRIEDLKAFLVTSNLEKLNMLEICLLIYTLRGIDYSTCESIVSKLNNQFALNSKSEVYKADRRRYFGIIMNMKTSSEKDKEKRADEKKESAAVNRSMDFVESNKFCRSIDVSQEKCKMKKKMCKKEKECFNDDDFEEELVIRTHQRNNLFKDTGSSKEYRETHYFNNQSISNLGSGISEFWVDLANYFLQEQDKKNRPNSTTNYNSSFITKNFVSKGLLTPWDLFQS